MDKVVGNLTKKFVLREIGESAFLVPLDRVPESLVSLNGSAVYIWKKLLSGCSTAQCAKELSERFTIQEEIIKRDIKKLFHEIEDGATKRVDVKNINGSLKSQRIPIQGSFELTGQCNLNCLHCYARGERKKKDLPLEKIRKIIDQLVESGCLFLQLTGGECLVRKDFKEIYLYIRRAGIIPTISTNATFFSDDLIGAFKKYPPYQIIVSLYGATDFVHDQITRVNGSFRKMLINVKRLKKTGFFIWFSAIVMKENFSEVSKMRNLARRMNVPIIFYPFLIPRLDKDKAPLAHCVGDEQCAQAVSFNKKTKPFQEIKQIKRQKKEVLYPCNAGLQSFHVDAEGKIYLCKIERSIGFSLLENSFKDSWRKLAKARNSKLRLPKICLDCDQRIECRVCPPMMRLYEFSGCGKVCRQRLRVKQVNLKS